MRQPLQRASHFFVMSRLRKNSSGVKSDSRAPRCPSCKSLNLATHRATVGDQLVSWLWCVKCGWNQADSEVQHEFRFVLDL